MNSALLTFAVLATQLLQIVFWIGFLWLGLRWAGIAAISTSKLAVVSIATLLLNVVCGATLLACLNLPVGELALLLIAVVLLAINVALPAFMIRRFFHLAWFPAVRAYLVTYFSLAPTFLLFVLVVRPFLFEAYVITSNSMAPTLRGRHWQGICPQCNANNFCTPRDPSEFGVEDDRQMICEQFHMSPRSRQTNPSDTIYSQDRVLVAKFRKPERWDMIVFRFPAQPRQKYVMRLVGLPGETIVIKNGGVWANGIRLEPPAELCSITYLDKDPFSQFQDFNGVEDNPAELQADEYFVLGDFSASASDSRYWYAGAAGHAPFAVPADHIDGVVSQIYWPPQRWRAF